jgi:long-chain fatty acid transport protein
MATVEAGANIDPIALFDARAAAMGDTGVAYISNGASIYHNPAGLAGIKTFSATLGVICGLPGLASSHVPLDGPDTEVSPTVAVIPVPFFGLGYRLSDHVVVGLSATPLAAAAAAFEDVKAFGGHDVVAVTSIVEFAPGASFQVNKDLTLGVAWRLSYLLQKQELPTLVQDQFVITKNTASELNTSGLHLGLQYRPSKTVQLGLSYRSKVSGETSGTTSTAGVDAAYSSSYSLPHRLKLGAAYSLLNEKLLVSLDMKFMFYRDSHDHLVTIVNTPSGDIATVTPIKWEDAAGIGIGAEYAVNPMFTVRAGYSLVSSAVPSESVSSFTPLSTPTYSFHVGGGLHFERIDVDLGAAYAASGGYQAPPNAFRGMYEGAGALVALSGTYHL